MVDRFSDLDDFEIVATRSGSAKRTRAGIRIVLSRVDRQANRPKWKKQLAGYRSGKQRGQRK